MKPSSMALSLLLIAACASPDAEGGAAPVSEHQTMLADGSNSHRPPPNTPTSPPPPPPPPPAACGDMNGGGDQHVDFPTLMATKQAEKPDVMQRQAALLQERYDLTDNPSPTLHMTRGKPVQAGIRVRLQDGTTW